MSSKSAITVDSDDDSMKTIELHRADSMVKPPIEFEEDSKTATPKENENAYTHVTSTLNSFIKEISQMKIEVIMFLYMFSYIMRHVSATSMILDKVCLVHLNFSTEICQDLKSNLTIKSQVEKLANNYSVGHSLLHMIPSAILGCFIGAWSDKYGRKVPLIASLLGIIIDGLGTTICAAYFYSRVEYYYIPAIFTGMSGGFISVMTIMYSYASDITTPTKRTMKYAVMEMTFGAALPLGQLAGGWLYSWKGYVPVFMISTLGHVIGLAWVLFVLEETRGLDNKDSWLAKFKSFWSTEPVLESMRATMKPRPNRGKEQILLLIIAMSFCVLTFTSTAGINFYYTHHVYDWDNAMYSTVLSIFSIIGTTSMVISVPIFKKFGLGDPTLGIVGTLSLMLKNFGIGAAKNVWIYYAANFTGLLNGLSTLAGRSRISKVASKDDLGKVFSFLTSAESILPIIASAITSQIFNATLDVYPGIIYLVLGALLFFPFAVFIWLSRLPSVNYEEMHNASESEQNLEPAEKVKKIQLEKC